MASNVPPESANRAPAPANRAPESALRNPGGDAVTPVNAFSNAVDPRKMYPTHFDHLMHDLFASGETPEKWRVLDASETRLDEFGMEVEFTLVRHGTDLVWRRRVLVDAGRLVKIETL